jgi:hypothetical protein
MLIEDAEGRWRKIKGHEPIALVRAGAKLVNGRLVEVQDDEKAAASGPKDRLHERHQRVDLCCLRLKREEYPDVEY